MTQKQFDYICDLIRNDMATAIKYPEEYLEAFLQLYEDSKKPAVRIESNSATTVKVTGNNNTTIL